MDILDICGVVVVWVSLLVAGCSFVVVAHQNNSEPWKRGGASDPCTPPVRPHSSMLVLELHVASTSRLYLNITLTRRHFLSFCLAVLESFTSVLNRAKNYLPHITMTTESLPTKVVNTTTTTSRTITVFERPTSSALPSAVPAPSSSKHDNSAAPLSHKSKFSLPKLRLEIRDLSHSGADVFLSAVRASKALEQAVISVLSLLYGSPTSHLTTVPTTRSVTLILRSMPGVAYTTGSELDDDHKEIHFSLEYINGIAAERRSHEIEGVLTHEMVHCYQYNAFGSCPGGLIEGIADWVRLNSDLSPPHWKKESTGNWDAGYQHTAYFLQYLEDRFGKGLIRKLNENLRITKYQEKPFWTELCGRPVEQLYDDYKKLLEKEVTKAVEEECVLVEKDDANSEGDKRKEDCVS